MTPYEHQVKISLQAYQILKEHAIVYLAMLERTGKTLTAILTCEHCSNVDAVLVLTKKKALDGWNATLAQYKSRLKFKVVNYHQATKLHPDGYQIVILDEAHSYLSKYPKVGEIWKSVSKLTTNKPIIYLSATPSAQGSSLLYHQFKLSSWSPFLAYSTFYKWFAEFGIPKVKYLGGMQVKDYSECNEAKVWEWVKHLFISYTREELGFKYEPIDKLHFVALSNSTCELYRTLEKDAVVTIANVEFVADSPMSLLTKLHQLEGGTLKMEEHHVILENSEKIDYLLTLYGDTEDLVIFYHYVQEFAKLSKYFKNARLLQSSAYAEGVDLSMYEHVVIYSMNFSTAQYIQRRARQANMKRATPIIVDYLLVKGGISHQVYECVAKNKVNFVDKYFKRGQV